MKKLKNRERNACKIKHLLLVLFKYNTKMVLYNIEKNKNIDKYTTNMLRYLYKCNKKVGGLIESIIKVLTKPKR